MALNVLAFGDVCGAAGLDFLSRNLWSLRSKYNADIVVVNGENAAGIGVTPAQIQTLKASGADVITLGNHTYSRREISSVLDDDETVIRPANYSPELPGTGVCIYDTGRAEVCVINLIGRVGMNVGPESPFDTAERLVEKYSSRTKYIVVDFHAEATSEKIAMAYLLDGKAGVLFGTHTHVQTADERIFPKGLGYITDIGMVGAADSVLGMKPDVSLSSLRGNILARFTEATGKAKADGALFTLDESGKCTALERLQIL